MPGLNCSFRIEEVQECENILIDPFESDDGDNDSLSDDLFTIVSFWRYHYELYCISGLIDHNNCEQADSEYSNSNHTWDYHENSQASGGSVSSDDSSDECSDDTQSEPSDAELSNSARVLDFDLDAVSHELCKMDREQCELAQNLIAAILHEGVMGRLTPNTVLKASTTEGENAVPAATGSS